MPQAQSLARGIALHGADRGARHRRSSRACGRRHLPGAKGKRALPSGRVVVVRDVRLSPRSGAGADIAPGPRCATSRHRRSVLGSSSTPENSSCRIETFVWIVTTFIISMAATPLRALATQTRLHAGTSLV